MRNNVAHGMLDDQAFQSFKALYISWFALKFCTKIYDWLE